MIDSYSCFLEISEKQYGQDALFFFLVCKVAVVFISKKKNIAYDVSRSVLEMLWTQKSPSCGKV